MKNYLMTILVLASLTVSALAQAPSGTWEYQFGETGSPQLWNFSGTYSEPFEASWHHTGRGRIESDQELRGNVSGNRGVVRVQIKADEWWRTTDDFLLFNEHLIRSKLSLQLSPENRALEGAIYWTYTTWWFAFGFHDRHTWGSFWEEIVLPLAPQIDGTWRLGLTVIEDGGRLTGTAVIVYPNDQTNHFRLTGKYYPTKQKFRLLLRGLEADRGASLSLWITTPELMIESMRGAVGGQRLRYP